MEGQDLRQTLVTIGISIVLADLMLRVWGGQYLPDRSAGLAVRRGAFPDRDRREIERRPRLFHLSHHRLFILAAAIVIGAGLWLVLNRTRIGMMIRAGVDDRDMLAATGVNVQLLFAIVFAFGAGLAGLAGVVGGTSPRWLRARTCAICSPRWSW